MKLTLFSVIFLLTASLVRCQQKENSSLPDYKNSYGELNYILPDSIKYTPNKGESKTIFIDKTMDSKNLILYRNLMLYADYGFLFSFDFDQMKKDTIVKSESFIYANELFIFGDTLVVFNSKYLMIIDLVNKSIVKELIGEFSNAELAKNNLFYSVIENHTETGVYGIDLTTNITKKLISIPSHTFSYGNYPTEKWSGMKLMNDNLFIHIGDNIYVVDCVGNNSVINFSTKFSGGVIFKGLKNKKVVFEDDGELIKVDLKTRRIIR
jgi:hypothetical protein